MDLVMQQPDGWLTRGLVANITRETRHRAVDLSCCSLDYASVVLPLYPSTPPSIIIILCGLE
jgi:hypothetical protein